MSQLVESKASTFVIKVDPFLKFADVPGVLAPNNYLDLQPPFPMSPRTKRIWESAIQDGNVRRSIPSSVPREPTEGEKRWLASGSHADWYTQWEEERRLTKQLLAHIGRLEERLKKQDRDMVKSDESSK